MTIIGDADLLNPAQFLLSQADLDASGIRVECVPNQLEDRRSRGRPQLGQVVVVNRKLDFDRASLSSWSSGREVCTKSTSANSPTFCYPVLTRRQLARGGNGLGIATKGGAELFAAW